MSKNDMVMVKRELLERYVSSVERHGYEFDGDREIRAALDVESEQHQGEPVALPARYVHEHHGCFLSERQHGWNACLDEIAKLGPLYARPVQGAPVAPIVIEVKDSCVYLRSGPLPPGQYQLYTRADPDEVERLRAQLKIMTRFRDEFEGKAERLEAKLAERDALLDGLFSDSPLKTWFNGSGEVLSGTVSHWMPMIPADAALSASAEPSAPAGAKDGTYCRICGTKLCVTGVCTIYCPNRDCGVVGVGTKMLGKQELERLKAGLPAFENDAELAMPVLVECDACHRSGGCVESCMKMPASAEPSALCERDERADYEKWLNEHVANHGSLGEVSRRQMLSENPEEAAWEGWEGRSALERKP